MVAVSSAIDMHCVFLPSLELKLRTLLSDDDDKFAWNDIFFSWMESNFLLTTVSMLRKRKMEHTAIIWRSKISCYWVFCDVYFLLNKCYHLKQIEELSRNDMIANWTDVWLNVRLTCTNPFQYNKMFEWLKLGYWFEF